MSQAIATKDGDLIVRLQVAMRIMSTDLTVQDAEEIRIAITEALFELRSLRRQLDDANRVINEFYGAYTLFADSVSGSKRRAK